MFRFIRNLLSKPKPEPQSVVSAKRSTLVRLQTSCIRSNLEAEQKPSPRRLGEPR